MRRVDDDLGVRDVVDRGNDAVLDAERFVNHLHHWREAVHDDLTGLLNRRGWRDAACRELAQAARSRDSVGIAVVDLDDLKQINDGASKLQLEGARLPEAVLKMTGL